MKNDEESGRGPRAKKSSAGEKRKLVNRGARKKPAGRKTTPVQSKNELDGDGAAGALTSEEEIEFRKLLRRLKTRPRDTVREEVPAILAAMVQRAKSGSHQDVKLLFELADIRAFLGEGSGSASEKKLVDLLFERLGLGEEAKRVRRAAHV